MNFAERLQKLQVEHGESNYRLAKTLSVHPSTVQSWKSGAQPRIEHLRKLSNHYGVSMDELISEKTKEA